MKIPKIKLNNYVNKPVLIGAVVGIILTFFLEKIFNPICEAFYSFVLQVGDHFLISFSNSTYREIARGSTEQASYALLYISILTLGFLLVIIKSTIDFTYQKTVSNIESSERKIYVFEHPEDESSDETQIALTKTDIDEFKNHLFAQKKHLRKLRIVIITILYVLYLFIVVVYCRQIYIHEKTVTAINNIEILAPYMSDQQYKQFKSEFYLIQNKQDYDSLLTALKDIASEENIFLPKQ